MQQWWRWWWWKGQTAFQVEDQGWRHKSVASTVCKLFSLMENLWQWSCVNMLVMPPKHSLRRKGTVSPAMAAFIFSSPDDLNHSGGFFALHVHKRLSYNTEGALITVHWECVIRRRCIVVSLCAGIERVDVSIHSITVTGGALLIWHAN